MRKITNVVLDIFYTPDYLNKQKVDPLPMRLELSKIESKSFNRETKSFDTTETVVPTGLQINSKAYFVNTLTDEVTKAIFEALKKTQEYGLINFDEYDELRVFEIKDDIPQLHEKIILESLYKQPNLIADNDLSLLNIDALYLPPEEFARTVINAEIFSIDSHPKSVAQDAELARVLNKTLFKLSPSEDMDHKYTKSDTTEISKLMKALNVLETPKYYEERKQIASTVDLPAFTDTSVANFLTLVSIEQDLNAISDYRELAKIIQSVRSKYSLDENKPLSEQIKILDTRDRADVLNQVTPEAEKPATLITAYKKMPLKDLYKFVTELKLEYIVPKVNINIGHKIRPINPDNQNAIGIKESQAETILKTQLGSTKNKPQSKKHDHDMDF